MTPTPSLSNPPFSSTNVIVLQSHEVRMSLYGAADEVDHEKSPLTDYGRFIIVWSDYGKRDYL
jgi:hypothetical protein